MDTHNFSEKVAERWSAWELRTLMLISLLLQIFLAIFGNRRKYMGGGRWFGASIWLAYLLADSVAVFSLGVMSCSASHGADHSDSNSTNPNYILVIWAPILLVHLGGPDTITAYSIEDNELWLRHLLTLLTQVGGAFYVSLKLWNNKEALPLAVITIFVAGLYKYGERTWALWHASSKKFRASIMANEAADEMSELLHLKIADQSSLGQHLASIGISNISDQAKILYKAQVLFQILKPLVSNLLLGHSRFYLSNVIITSSEDATEAFGVIEVELGFVYDVLYTKMTSVSFLTRIVLRLIGFLFTISALAALSSMMTISKHDKYYSKIDTVILYTLLAGAILIEIYSIMVLLFSDWTMLWISMEMNEACAKRFHGAIWSCPLRSFFNNDNRRWSGSMAQHDIFIASGHRVKNLVQRWEMVSVKLKELIFKQLSEKRCHTGLDDLKQALEERGDGVLRRNNLLQNFGWSTVDLEFHQSLLTWHIATSICYWEEFHKYRDRFSRLKYLKWILMIKSLSDYMMYLLADSNSNMLPKGIAGPRYSGTITDIKFTSPAIYDLTQKRLWEQFYTELHRRYSGRDLQQKWDDRSALASGFKLAITLIAKDWSDEERWTVMSEVWVEMLTYAACHCEWKEHAQALPRGGELLTLVYLITTHLGFSMQRADDFSGDITRPFA